MTWSIPIPSTVDEILMWSQATLVWTVANHGPRDEPIGSAALSSLTETQERSLLSRTLRNSLLACGLVVLLPGFTLSQNSARTALGLLTFSFVYVAPRVRLRCAKSQPFRGFLAELEIGTNALFAASVAVLIGLTHLTVSNPLLSLPLRSARLSAINLGLATAVFMSAAGTRIVRGVLDKANTLPRSSPSTPPSEGTEKGTNELAPELQPAVDVPEYNRGRTIGNLERLLMLAIVAVGSYEALGFLMAAKGLIRAREFEDRDFAEYFIVGSLASAAVALLVGILLRLAVLSLWTE